MQALYEMEIGGQGVVEAMAEFEALWIGKEVEDIELARPRRLLPRPRLGGVVREQRLARPARRRDAGEGLAVEAGRGGAARHPARRRPTSCYFRKDVPARAVISEYVAVARAFYEGEESGMINAVLDALARDARPDEFDSGA